MIIGFIGLGIMGRPMAINLIKAGKSLIVYDINPKALSSAIEHGAKKATSIAEVAAASQIVITMLPNSPQVKEVVLCLKAF